MPIFVNNISDKKGFLQINLIFSDFPKTGMIP